MTTDIQKILFLDIETIPCAPSYQDMPQGLQPFWDHKAANVDRTGEMSSEELFNRAGIYAEFGRIVCISVGIVHQIHDNQEIHIKSFASHDEKSLLEGFCELLKKLPNNNLLCAHNGKEFDFPYICRRLIVNAIPIPYILQIMGKKPWEVAHIDTMELWKFGDRKNFTSLALLAEILQVPTPKDEMDGSMVHGVYQTDGGLEQITEYCQKDVVALIQVYQRMMNLPISPVESVIYK
jgi:uncharacterized protein YprB with RNaseH-like and TPR domain